jgi:hypothetical protein
MSSQHLHQVVLQWYVAPPDCTDKPHTDAKGVIVTDTFNKASLPIAFLFHSCLPLPLPFHPSLFPHRRISVYTRPVPFALPASPIALKHPLSSSHGDKVTYKFIIGGCWVTNAKPIQVDHGFINNVYTAPPKSIPP